jgi:cell division FtsZ-interacting protein ZapD
MIALIDSLAILSCRFRQGIHLNDWIAENPEAVHILRLFLSVFNFILPAFSLFKKYLFINYLRSKQCRQSLQIRDKMVRDLYQRISTRLNKIH